MAKFVCLRNWERYQHYKDRSPPWIKLYVDILSSEAWVAADDASRVLAMALMVLAARTSNKIPLNFAYIRRVAYLNSDPNLQPLIDSQFIEIIDDGEKVEQVASTPLATCLLREEKSREEKSREEKSREDTTAAAPPTRNVPRETSPDWMLDFKLAYPARAGDPNWRGALKAGRARVAEGHTAAEFLAGARRYAAFCEAAGKTNTEFVQQASRFLGPSKPFLLPWHAPPRAETAMDRILRANTPDESRVFDHEPELLAVASH